MSGAALGDAIPANLDDYGDSAKELPATDVPLHASMPSIADSTS
jgi:hypothetical protein